MEGKPGLKIARWTLIRDAADEEVTEFHASFLTAAPVEAALPVTTAWSESLDACGRQLVDLRRV